MDSANAGVFGTFYCPHCPRCFHKKPLFDKHLVLHLSGKCHECPTCKMVFSIKSIHNHRVSHSDEKSFKCDFCVYCTKRKGDLRRHLLVVHSDSKPLKCDFCVYCTKRKGDLRQHLLVMHSDSKPFKCDFCVYSCGRKSYLRSHLLAHHSDEVIACDKCSKSCTIDSIDDHKCDPDLLEPLDVVN